MEVLHFFKFILVLVHPQAYYSVYKIVYSAFTLLFYRYIYFTIQFFTYSLIF